MAKILWKVAFDVLEKAAKKFGTFDVIVRAGNVDLKFVQLDTDMDLRELIEILKPKAGFVMITGEHHVVAEEES